jgi:hypothetical protein
MKLENDRQVTQNQSLPQEGKQGCAEDEEQEGEKGIDWVSSMT